MKKYFLFLTLPLFAVDQLTKWLVVRFIPQGEEITIIPGFFQLVQVHNTGAAFGMFANNNLFFISIAVVALAVIAILARRGAFREKPMAIAAALLVSGILGNFTDRLTRRFVVDFLLFDLHVPYANPWPTFNIADSCICVAAGLFVLGSLFEKKGAKIAAK